MNNREKNIHALADAMKYNIKYFEDNSLAITEDNYDRITPVMSAMVAQWYDSTDIELEEHTDDLVNRIFTMLYELEAMHMIYNERRSARG